MEKDYKGVPEELTPKWWKNKMSPNDFFVVIPDTEYNKEQEQINYGEGGESGEVDYLTGVIVKAPVPFKGMVGRWCHYRQHGPYVFHPFRERFSNGKGKAIEKKVAKSVHPDNMVLITDKIIFDA